jgi:uncharacterized protein YfeS
MFEDSVVVSSSMVEMSMFSLVTLEDETATLSKMSGTSHPVMRCHVRKNSYLSCTVLRA